MPRIRKVFLLNNRSFTKLSLKEDEFILTVREFKYVTFSKTVYRPNTLSCVDSGVSGCLFSTHPMSGNCTAFSPEFCPYSEHKRYVQVKCNPDEKKYIHWKDVLLVIFLGKLITFLFIWLSCTARLKTLLKNTDKLPQGNITVLKKELLCSHLKSALDSHCCSNHTIHNQQNESHASR